MKDYDEVAATIAAGVHSGLRLSPREIRDAPWCLWETTPALASDRPVLMSVLEAVIRSERPRPYLALAASYVSAFRVDLPGIDQVAPALAYLAGRWDSSWTELHRSFALFDPKVGPRKLALEVVARDQPVVEILRERRLGSISERGGYAKAVTLSLLRELALAADADHLARLGKVQRFALEGGLPIFPDQSTDTKLH